MENQIYNTFFTMIPSDDPILRSKYEAYSLIVLSLPTNSKGKSTVITLQLIFISACFLKQKFEKILI